MKYQSYIEELKNIATPLELDHISRWLKKYEVEFYKVLPITNCKKWHKWLYKEEQPYPCVCPLKERDCEFIELYYDLMRTMQELSHDIESLDKRINRNF